MSPKPLTPDDEIIYVNKAGIRKKKGKSGNSQKRSDYFLQQRFPFIKPLAEDEEKRSGKKKHMTPEEQQEAAAPLARARQSLLHEYQDRLLAQKQEQENKVIEKTDKKEES